MVTGEDRGDDGDGDVGEGCGGGSEGEAEEEDCGAVDKGELAPMKTLQQPQGLHRTNSICCNLDLGLPESTSCTLITWAVRLLNLVLQGATELHLFEAELNGMGRGGSDAIINLEGD